MHPFLGEVIIICFLSGCFASNSLTLNGTDSWNMSTLSSLFFCIWPSSCHLVLFNNPETNSFNLFTSKFFLKMPQLLPDEISCWKIVCDERVGRRCAPLGSRFDQNDVYHPFYLQNKLVIKCTITFQNWLWVYKNQKRSPRPLNGGKCFLNRTPRPKS